MRQLTLLLLFLCTVAFNLKAQTEHVIQRGETLETIAKHYGVTVDELKSANPNKLLNDLGGIRKKLKLDIPAVQKEQIEAWING